MGTGTGVDKNTSKRHLEYGESWDFFNLILRIISMIYVVGKISVVISVWFQFLTEKRLEALKTAKCRQMLGGIMIYRTEFNLKISWWPNLTFTLQMGLAHIYRIDFFSYVAHDLLFTSVQNTQTDN